MGKKLFTNCHIVDVIGKTVTEGSVLVEDGVITAVGAAEAGDAEVIDLGGKYVMPGLFNCHTHICLPPDPATNYSLNDCQVTMKALKHLRQFLDTGVTFIRDVGGMNFIDIDIRNAAAKGGKAAREQLRAGADWIKVMGTGGVMTEGVEPGSPQLDEDELRAAITEGHKVGAKACTHSQGMTGIKNALRAGVDSIEHGFYMDDWCFDWMKEHDVYYVPTLAAMYWIKVNGTAAGIPEFAVRKVNATFEDHLSTFRNAYKAGVKIVLGTDAGTPFNPHDKTAYEMILMTNAGMDVWDALRAGTIVAAEMCGVDKTHGSIEAGKKANLAVFAEDPTQNLETVMNCQMTVLGGDIVYQA